MHIIHACIHKSNGCVGIMFANLWDDTSRFVLIWVTIVFQPRDGLSWTTIDVQGK